MKNVFMCLSIFLFSTPIFAITDPEIAHVVVTANAVDIDAGRLAKLKSKNKEVREFAQTMINDHLSVNKEAAMLVAKLKVKPTNNEISKSLASGGKDNIKNLRKLSWKKFDIQYVNHEVAYHQAVLDTIDKTLIPNSENLELKALIEKVRPAIAAHLEHAKSMQTSMMKTMK
jgi:putative membrane protein